MTGDSVVMRPTAALEAVATRLALYGAATELAQLEGMSADELEVLVRQERGWGFTPCGPTPGPAVSTEPSTAGTRVVPRRSTRCASGSPQPGQRRMVA